MRRSKEGPAAWIAAAAAVVIIPVTVVFGLLSVKSGASDSTPADPGNAAAPAPAHSQVATAEEACLRTDGTRTSCADADAWLIVPSSHCDAESVSRALGAVPDEIELQIETKQISGHCVVAPSTAAKTAGATISDLTNIRHDSLPARILTCWQDADPGTAVPCSQPHHFEPAAHWTPLSDRAEPESVCPEAVRYYVAGPADSMDGALSTSWVVSQEQEPRFRCLVKSRDALAGTVYRLSGRPLPTAAPG